MKEKFDILDFLTLALFLKQADLASWYFAIYWARSICTISRFWFEFPWFQMEKIFPLSAMPALSHLQ